MGRRLAIALDVLRTLGWCIVALLIYAVAFKTARLDCLPGNP